MDGIYFNNAGWNPGKIHVFSEDAHASELQKQPIFLGGEKKKKKKILGSG